MDGLTRQQIQTIDTLQIISRPSSWNTDTLRMRFRSSHLFRPEARQAPGPDTEDASSPAAGVGCRL